jgi:phospholipid/cholesterol/gamma-HCH transport system substrate-binding protein
MRNAPHESMVSSREVKVGAFVLIGLLFVGLVVFLIGDERQVFSSKVSFRAIFDDVEGLKTGSSVRMGGIDVGSIESVGYAEDSSDVRLHVKFSVVKSQARRIRTDSKVKIESKGFLGDKMIAVVAGNPKLPPIVPGGMIEAEPDQKDLQNALAHVGSITAKAEKIMENLDATTSHFAEPALQENLRSSIESLSHILHSTDQGPGYVSRLLNDRSEAERLSNTIERLDLAAVQLERSLASVAGITERIEKGPGLVHELVYSEQSSKSVAQIGEAAEQLALSLRGIREGKGMARALLFGDGNAEQSLAQVNQILGDLHGIVADVRAGKGTLGALLTDPSVYEDLKLLLGNVERNKSLRALVRYSIEQDEATHAGPAAPKK